jgi:hypothetical protein
MTEEKQLRDEYISVVLSAELLVFCKAHNLPFIDAAELVLDEDLTDFQFGWLMAFNRLWESLL